MTNLAIKVENLSKAFLLGMQEEKHESLLGSLAAFMRSPLDNFRKIKRLGNLGDTEESDDVFWALKDISFEVNEGEVVGIIGKNGAGKSTLLKILSQITEPTRGRITINGRVASLLEVGTGFNEELTGRENVYLNGTILGMTKKEIDARYNEIIEFSGVEKFIDTPVKRYSSGMRVRLAFAVAAHLDPEILIIDEVLAVGDAEFQKKCLGKMQAVAGQGRTVLFVSHNMNAIKNLCNRCIILKNGKTMFDGGVDEAVHTYLELNLKETSTGEIPRSFARTYNSGEGYFNEIRILAADETETSDLFYREPILFDVGFDAVTEIQDPYFSLMICTRDGEKAVYIENIDSYKDSKGIVPGRYRFRYKMLTHLLPGDYTVTLSCSHTFTGSSIDFAEGVAAFSVMKTSRLKDKDYPWQKVHGHVLANSEWKLLN